MAVQCASAGAYLTRSGSYLNPALDWTKSVWVQWPSDPTTYFTAWLYGPASRDYTTPWLFFGTQGGGTNNTGFVADPGSGGVDVGYTATMPPRWYYLTAVYTAATTTVEFFLNGVSKGTGSIDLSGMTAQASDVLGSDLDGPPDFGNSIAYDRIWQAALTGAQILAEMQSATAVTTAALLADCPLTNASTLTDRSGNGRNYTAFGSITTVDGPVLDLPASYLAVGWYASTTGGRVNLFSRTGENLGLVWSSNVSGDAVQGLAFDSAGQLWIGHPGSALNGIILEVFDADGQFVQTINASASYPVNALIHGIVADSNGAIYVVTDDTGFTGTIGQYATDGSLTRTMDAAGCVPGVVSVYVNRALLGVLYTGSDADDLSRYSVGLDACVTPLHTSIVSNSFTSTGLLPDGRWITTNDSGNEFDVRILNQAGTVVDSLKGPNWSQFDESQTEGGWYDGSLLWLIYNYGTEIVGVTPTAPNIVQVPAFTPSTTGAVLTNVVANRTNGIFGGGPSTPTISGVSVNCDSKIIAITGTGFLDNATVTILDPSMDPVDVTLVSLTLTRIVVSFETFPGPGTYTVTVQDEFSAVSETFEGPLTCSHTVTTYPVRRLRRFMLPWDDANRQKFISRLEFVMKTGIGIPASVPDPVMHMRLSPDGGITWGPLRAIYVGRQGDYSHRAFLTRLGRARQPVIELTMSDPVNFQLVEAIVDMEEGTS